MEVIGTGVAIGGEEFSCQLVPAGAACGPGRIVGRNGIQLGAFGFQPFGFRLLRTWSGTKGFVQPEQQRNERQRAGGKRPNNGRYSLNLC